jgi:hypothetical protein
MKTKIMGSKISTMNSNRAIYLGDVGEETQGSVNMTDLNNLGNLVAFHHIYYTRHRTDFHLQNNSNLCLGIENCKN